VLTKSKECKGVKRFKSRLKRAAGSPEPPLKKTLRKEKRGKRIP